MEKLIFELIYYVLGKNVLLVYGFFFLSSFLQMVFPPHPGDVILVFQGYLTTMGGSFDFIPVLVTNLAATITGSLCIYKLGYKNGENVLEFRLVKKYILQKHREKAARLFDKYGYFAILISKFLPGVNAVMLLFAGIFKVRARHAFFSIFVSSLLHHIFCLVLGRLVGYNIQNIKHILATYNLIIIILVSTVAVVFGAYYFMFSKWSRREKI